MILGSQTITVTGDPVRDRHGDPVGAGQVRQVPGCRVQPVNTQEMWEGPEGTITISATLYAPPEAGLREREHIRYRAARYRIVGTPQIIPDLHGRPHHYEVRLREVHGPIKDAQAG